MENIFCTKCRKLAAQKKVTPDRIQLLQNGRTLISLSKQVPARKPPWWEFWHKPAPAPRSRGNRIGVRCPDGHSVPVEL